MEVADAAEETIVTGVGTPTPPQALINSWVAPQNERNPL
jgi:hypothetical protein